MSFPSCLISGTVYLADGRTPAVGVYLAIHKLLLENALISSTTLTVGPSDSNGFISFTLPQGSVAHIQGNVRFFTSTAVCQIPNQSTYPLELLPPPTTIPPVGATVSQLDAHANTLANPNVSGHIVNVAGGGISLSDGVLTVQPVSQEIVQDYLATFFNSLTPALHSTYNDPLNRVDFSIDLVTGSADGLMSAADYLKLQGIATGATVNQTDAYLLDRTHHTGAQAISTVTGLQTALDSKALTSDLANEAATRAAADALLAPLASPVFTGIPTAPTAANVTANTQIATTAFVHGVITDLINAAPAALDTLGEIATQLANDESAVSALTVTVSGKLAKASNLSDLTNAATAQANLFGTQSANLVYASPTTGAAAAPSFRSLVVADIPTLTSAKISDFNSAASSAAPVQSVAGRAGAVTLTNADVGLSAVTNDAQTKAAIVPNTLPSSAQILVGNAGGTAYAPQSLSGDGSLSSTGALTVTKTNGVEFGTMAVQAEANYALLAGRSGGQTLNGGTNASENITIQSTSNPTKGYILLGTGGLVGVNKGTPGAQLHVAAKDSTTLGMVVQMAASPNTTTGQPFQIWDSTGATVLLVKTDGSIAWGATSSFPMLKRSGNELQSRLGDDSAYSNFAAGNFIARGGAGTFQIEGGGGGRVDVNGLAVSSAASVRFSSTTAAAGTADASISRQGVNIIQIGDGGANANGTLKAARFQFSTTVTPTGSADAQGNTGDVRYDDNFLYIRTATGGWKRAALSTF